MAYDLDVYTKPLWEGTEVYYETAMFVGKEDVASMLYPIDEVIGVYDFAQKVEYVQGVDYEIIDGKIKRVNGGNIPYYKLYEYYRDVPDVVNIMVNREVCKEAPEGRNFFVFGEKDTFSKMQVCVSYKHKSKWSYKIPKGKRDVFKKALDKLDKKQEFSMLFFGDSITTGCNSSGVETGGNVPPYADSFPIMVWKKLQKTFDTEIKYTNTAVGGWNTLHAITNFQEKALSENYDLLILGFGMNDMRTNVQITKNRTEEMIIRFREKNPNAPILLLATMLPNINSNWLCNQKLHAGIFEELAIKYPHVAVANITEIHEDILKTKRYRDMTGNNVNHPNDFLARIYAQTIIKTILG